jgi:uncharacterized protein
MSTEPMALTRRRCLGLFTAWGLVPWGGSGLAIAQTAAPPTPKPPTGGTGAGVHSPDSPYAPLVPRSDVVAWSTLSQVEQKVVKSRIVQVYAPAILALHQKTVRVQGFMAPLDPGERQVHFLLTSVPLTCAFCTPGGAESMVQVRTRGSVRYSMEAVVVEGRFHVLHNDSTGFYYRMTDAVAVK